MPRDISDALGDVARADKEAAAAINELENALKSVSNVTNRQFYPSIDKSVKRLDGLTLSVDKYKRNSKGVIKEVDKLSRGYSEIDKTGEKATKTNKEFASSIKKETDELKKQAVKLRESKQATSDFNNEVKEASSLLGLLKKKGEETHEEFKRMGDGAGEGATGMFAAGLAAVYLADKVSELGDNVLDTIKALREYDVAASALAKTSVIAPGGLAQLEKYREELSMTRQQSLEYFNVLKEGAETGIISVVALREAAMKLQETFGGDPTQKLKEYVDLLKEIPTLETDLSITASLSDQAATWFAIAKRGKIQQVIEFQMTGLAGGIKLDPEGTEAQVKTLNEMMVMNKRLEDFQNRLTSMIGPWGPKIVSIAKMALTGIGTLGGIWAVSIGSKRILAQILARQGGGYISPVRQGFRAFGSQYNMQRGRGLGILTSLRAGGRAAGTRMTNVGNQIAADGGITGAATVGLGKALTTLMTPVSKVGSLFSGLIPTLTTVGGVLSSFIVPFLFMAENSEEFGNAIKKAGRDAKGTKLEKLFNNLTMLNPPLLALRAVGIKTTDIIKGIGSAMQFAGPQWEYIWDSIKKWAWTNDNLTKEQKARSAEEERLKKIQQERAKDLLKMQEIISATDKGFNTAKTELHDMNVAIAQAKLEELKYIGGDVEDFNKIIREGTKAAKESYKIREGAGKTPRELAKEIKNETIRRTVLKNIINQEIEARKKNIDAIISMAEEIKKRPRVLIAEQRAAQAESQAGLGFALGRVDGNITKQIRARGDYLLKQMNATQDAIEFVSKNLGTGKTRDDNILVLEQYKSEQDELAKSYVELSQRSVDLLSVYKEFPKVKAADAVAEAAGALADTADFFGDTEMAARAANEQIKAANKSYELEMNLLKRFRAESLSSIENQIKIANTINNTELRNAELSKLNAQKQEIIAKSRKENDDLALKKAKEISDAIKKRADTDLSVVDMEQGLLEEQIGFLEEMGGSYGSILNMQKQSVVYEAQKLQIAQEALEFAIQSGARGKDLRQFEINVEKQKMELTKKAMGAQRSTYEKLLELAFGAIRSSRGARRGIMSEAMMFGRQRVRGRSGMLLEGQPMPIHTRSAMMMGAAGNVPGVLGMKPSRLPAESRMRGGMATVPNKTGGMSTVPGFLSGMPLVKGEEEKSNVNVKATVRVEFDNAMFKTKLVHIITSDPQIQNALANSMEGQRFIRNTV